LKVRIRGNPRVEHLKGVPIGQKKPYRRSSTVCLCLITKCYNSLEKGENTLAYFIAGSLTKKNI
jgi:hypothetical protein